MEYAWNRSQTELPREGRQEKSSEKKTVWLVERGIFSVEFVLKSTR